MAIVNYAEVYADSAFKGPCFVMLSKINLDLLKKFTEDDDVLPILRREEERKKEQERKSIHPININTFNNYYNTLNECDIE